ncbi:hypothetical protein [Sphingomonas arenae]|uniref:hypothetical protein n=1 Tax=Sphingomonas arenae TaxID=2812555 RepID=UPI001967CCA7|nr:hypothetical protein [Sphingomonas arenae]
MRRPLIASDGNLWRNAFGIVATAIIVPVAFVVKIVTMPFERPVQRTASEVARYIREFIEGTGGDWDWDDFQSIPIANAALNSIRERASRVMEPVDEEGMTTLRRLLAEAEALAENEPHTGVGG